MTADELTRQGYRRVSNKFGMVARIDRPDWLEFMLEQSPHLIASLADQYRRVHSQDVLTVPGVAPHVPTSSHDSVGFVSSEDPE